MNGHPGTVGVPMSSDPILGTMGGGTPSGLWWTDESDAVAARLGVDPAVGLTSAGSAARVAADGYNDFLETPAKRACRLFAAQFANTMIVVLVVAGLVMAAIGDLKDALVIAAVVFLNAVIGFAQDDRAERASVAFAFRTTAKGHLGEGRCKPCASAMALPPPFGTRQ